MVPPTDPRDMAQHAFEREVVGEAGVVVVASTIILTASFIGLVALANGVTLDTGSRLPFYVLGMAMVFVAAMFQLDSRRRDGMRVMAATVGIAILSFVIVTLAGEGIYFAYHNPGQILAQHLVVYFVAAALICTGLAFWTLRHWREFTGTSGWG